MRSSGGHSTGDGSGGGSAGGRSTGGVSAGGTPPEPAPLLLTCIVMEYCSGGTLAQAIEQGAFYRDAKLGELDEASQGGGLAGWAAARGALLAHAAGCCVILTPAPA